MKDPVQVEEVIAQLWKQSLEIDEIQPDQTYFDLGGDSLRMIDMLLTVGQKLEREIDPTLLFEDATLRGFSKLVERLPTLSDLHKGSL